MIQSFLLHPRRSSAGSPRSGFTLIELMIVTVVLVVAMKIFAETIVASSRQRVINHENALASEAARFQLESLREVPFGLAFALYNPTALDDPGGPGTAPGHRFAVEGLVPTADSPDGLVGEIVFPAVDLGGGLFELRENLVDRSMGMPRDLNGDSIVDSADHSLDYIRLPVSIRLRWQGPTGPRTARADSMLCLMRFAP